MSGAVMLVMALLPGIPMLPFLLLGGGAGALAYIIDKRQKARARRARPRRSRPPKARRADEPISAALKIDDLKIELGYALLPLVNSPDGTDRLTEQIKALRRSLAIEMGFVMPAVRILDNVQLEANSYVIKIKEVEAGTGQIWPGQYMVMDPTGAQVKLPGLHTTEPTFGLPATWVDVAQKEEAAIKGYTVVDAATVLSTHLTELLKANMAELLSYAEVQKLLKELPKEQGELVKDIVPAQITVSGIQRVLQILLAERISIRDLVDHPRRHRRRARRSPAIRSTIAEHVRARLARQICAQHTTPARLPAADRAVGASGSRTSPSRSSARATSAASPCSRRGCRSSSRWSASASRTPPARARRRCWSPRPASGRSCAASSSASAPRPACCRSRKSTAGPAEDRRQHLEPFARRTPRPVTAFQRNVNGPWNPAAPSYVDAT